MFIVTPTSVLNPAAVETRYIPRQFLGRSFLIPVRGASFGTVLRMVFEVEILRYLAALLPFALAALIWQDRALAIAQAPVVMFIVIYAVEMRFLRPTTAARQSLLAAGDADRGLDLLRTRSVAILTHIAAGRGLTQGVLHLVVEQSEMFRVAPLTFVSVQSEDGPELLRLTPEEETEIRTKLFEAPLTERDLHRITLSLNRQIHDNAFDPRAVSAHARLAAFLKA